MWTTSITAFFNSVFQLTSLGYQNYVEIEKIRTIEPSFSAFSNSCRVCMQLLTSVANLCRLCRSLTKPFFRTWFMFSLLCVDVMRAQKTSFQYAETHNFLSAHRLIMTLTSCKPYLLISAFHASSNSVGMSGWFRTTASSSFRLGNTLYNLPRGSLCFLVICHLQNLCNVRGNMSLIAFAMAAHWSTEKKNRVIKMVRVF